MHRSFKEHLRVPYPLLSDIDGRVSKPYGVLTGEDGYLKGRCERAVFIIDARGIIRFKWVAPDAAQEPDYDKMLDIAKSLYWA